MQRLALYAAGIAFAGVLLVSHCVQAQTAPAPQERVYTLQLSGPEIVTMAQGLGSMPYRDVAGLLKKIDEQITAQNIAAQKALGAQPPENK